MPEKVNGFIWFTSICFTRFFSTKEIRVYQQRLGISKLRSDISGNYQRKFNFEINSIYFHTRKNLNGRSKLGNFDWRMSKINKMLSGLDYQVPYREGSLPTLSKLSHLVHRITYWSVCKVCKVTKVGVAKYTKTLPPRQKSCIKFVIMDLVCISMYIIGVVAMLLLFYINVVLAIVLQQ